MSEMVRVTMASLGDSIPPAIIPTWILAGPLSSGTVYDGIPTNGSPPGGGMKPMVHSVEEEDIVE